MTGYPPDISNCVKHGCLSIYNVVGKNIFKNKTRPFKISSLTVYYYTRGVR